jgi:uncharacterized protein YceK
MLMLEILAALLLYPLSATVTVVEAVWVSEGLIGLALAVRKRYYADVYERERRAAYDAGVVSEELNGDRAITSAMNIRTATMACAFMVCVLVAGCGSMVTPTRADEYADTGALVTFALVVMVSWVVRWLVLDFRDALRLRARIAEAEARSSIRHQVDHIEEVVVETNQTIKDALDKAGGL